VHAACGLVHASSALALDKQQTAVCGLLPSPGVAQIDRVVEAVEATLAGQQLVLLGRRKLPALDLPKVSEWCGWSW
jgi:hypothetical protein